MKETELKPCPFCGGKAETHYQPLYTSYGVCIMCTECKARSKFFPCDCTYQYYHGEKNVYITKERATSDAINLWNRRADNEQSEGEWKTEDTILGKCCTCSVCGSCPTREYKFCPYCGAKMKGGAE